MSNTLRSKHGCWTCRLRKKKCDESHPECLTCKTLSIICYGYGPRPDWMDNGDAEKAVADHLKQVVKYTSRRKGKGHTLTRPKRAVQLVPVTSSHSTSPAISTSGSDRPQQENGVSPEPGSLPDGQDTPDERAFVNPVNGSHIAGSPSPIPAEDSLLLMHFLDHVLPLQYPIYSPNIIEGGRGWLLSLLLRTKPLYHAALALASYHRRIMVFEQVRPECRIVAIQNQAKHLEVCLASVRNAIALVSQYAQRKVPRLGIGTVSSVVQLVFFELFAGQGTAWQMHLGAAIDLYDRACRDALHHLGLAEESRNILRADLPLSVDGPIVTEEVTTFRFMAASVIWFDIIASVTAGIEPKLMTYHAGTLTRESWTKLEHIMGCKNWVMLQIGRIAALHWRRIQGKQLGQCSTSEFDRTAIDITNDIEYGRTHEALEHLDISEQDLPEPSNTRSGQISLVTSIFVHMASIYLHLVKYGFHRLEMLDTTISRAMDMLCHTIPKRLLPALVAPLYIIGSVARQGEEQQFFRTAFLSRPLQDPFFVHRGRILSILEEIWSARQENFTWNNALELSHDLLLL